MASHGQKYDRAPAEVRAIRRLVEAEVSLPMRLGRGVATEPVVFRIASGVSDLCMLPNGQLLVLERIWWRLHFHFR